MSETRYCEVVLVSFTFRGVREYALEWRAPQEKILRLGWQEGQSFPIAELDHWAGLVVKAEAPTELESELPIATDTDA